MPVPWLQRRLGKQAFHILYFRNAKSSLFPTKGPKNRNCLNLGRSSDGLAVRIDALHISLKTYHFGMLWLTLTFDCQCLCLKSISKAIKGGTTHSQG